MEIVVKCLMDMGFKVIFGEYVVEMDCMMSLSICLWVVDIYEVFNDLSVKVILMVIGGFNSN